MRASGRVIALVAFLLGAVACAKLVGADFDHAALRLSDRSDGGGIVLTAPHPHQTSAEFGYTLAFDAKSLVVTAPYEDVETITGTKTAGGATYVFDVTNPFAPPVALVVPNVDARDGILPGTVVPQGFVGLKEWGSLRVALNDNVIAVGNPAEDSASTDPADNSAPESGAVYLYDRAELGSPPQYLKAPRPEARAIFGESLSLSGSRLAVGAPGEDDVAVDSGAVYVYEWHNGFDNGPVRIKPEIAHAGDSFGSSVAIEDDLLVVGAPGESSQSTGFQGDPNDTSLIGNGAVYIYRLLKGTWTLEQYVKPAMAQATGVFGFIVSVSGGRIAIGAPGATACPNEVIGTDRGTAYVVESTAGKWCIEKCLTTGPVFESMFGWSVALHGDELLVGAPWDPSGRVEDGGDHSYPYSGGAHFYRRTAAGDWVKHAYIKAPDIQANDVFGFSVAISSGMIATGAPFAAGGPHGPDPTHYSGAAYLFSIDAPSDGGPP